MQALPEQLSIFIGTAAGRSHNITTGFDEINSITHWSKDKDDVHTLFQQWWLSQIVMKTLCFVNIPKMSTVFVKNTRKVTNCYEDVAT